MNGNQPTLFIVASPIGNLKDFSFRALEVLKEADLVLAEDTRRTKILLHHYEVFPSQLWSYHEHTTEQRWQSYQQKISAENCRSIAYLSDAGTPGVSDPGGHLVARARAAGWQVIPIPGASSVTTLLSVAGFPTDRFLCLGFLPHKKGRQSLLKTLPNYSMTIVILESVHRLPRLLQELLAVLGPERQLIIGRELTKQYETLYCGTLGDLSQQKLELRGEFILALAPAGFTPQKPE